MSRAREIRLAMISVSHPWVLLLLVLCVAPLVAPSIAVVRFSSMAVFPSDPLSTLVAIAVRIAKSATLGLVALGLSGPFIPERNIERIGEGAQIIILLDRSRSMDEPFGGHAARRRLVSRGDDAKGVIARQLLSQFVAGRRNDKYGMLVFSTKPIQVLPLTDKTDIIKAAISAGNVGRGLSATDVGTGIIEAVSFFENQPYTGSRVVLLVSDGGARLDQATRIHIADMLRRYRVALYWVYIRSTLSPGLVVIDPADESEDTSPARVLHEYFKTLETPYRVFDAEDPKALAAAISEVNKLQSLPIRYIDVVPRNDIARWFYAAGIILLAGLLIVERMEIRRW